MTTRSGRLQSLAGGARLQFLQFCVVGAVGFLVDAGILMAVTHLGLADPVSGRLISFALAVLATFELNRRWVFSNGEPQPYVRSLAGYLGVQGVGFLVNFAIYTLLVLGAPAPFNHPLLCLAVASGVALFVNFAGAKLLVFKRRVPPLSGGSAS